MINETQSAPASPLQSFADMVDYPKLYAELEQKGHFLTEKEKKELEEISADRLRNHDGGQVIGNSFGGSLQGIVYMLFAFFKNIFAGGSGDGSIGDMASQIGPTMTSTNEQGKLYQLQLAESETYERLKQRGGNLAAAAEYITGMKPSGDNSDGQILQSSILNQVGAHINLPVDTNTSLNAQPASLDDIPVQTGLPRTSTQPLTTRG